jgi:hypothetical protein
VSAKIWKGVDEHGNIVCPADYKTAKGILEGVIKNVSTGLFYSFRQSHDMAPHEFFSTVGEVVGGEEVRLIITKVIAILELSLVVYGADQYAKKLSALLSAHGVNSKDVLAAFTNNHLEIFAGRYRRRKSVMASLPDFGSRLTIETDRLSDQYKHAQNDIESLETINANLSAENDSLRDEIERLKQQHKQKLEAKDRKHAEAVHSNTTRYQELSNKYVHANSHIKHLQEDIENMTHLSEYGERYIAVTRDTAIRAYKLLCVSTPEVSETEQVRTIQMLMTAPVDFVENMLSTFSSKALQVIPHNRVSRLNIETSPQYFSPAFGYRRQFSSRLHQKGTEE